MASVLALQRIFPHNGSLLGRLASRRLREERKLLERPGRSKFCRDVFPLSPKVYLNL